MALHAQPLPGSKLLLGGGAGGFGHQAQRVAAEVGAGPAIGAGRQVKLVAKSGQRVGSVGGGGGRG